MLLAFPRVPLSVRLFLLLAISMSAEPVAFLQMPVLPASLVGIGRGQGPRPIPGLDTSLLPLLLHLLDSLILRSAAAAAALLDCTAALQSHRCARRAAAALSVVCSALLCSLLCSALCCFSGGVVDIALWCVLHVAVMTVSCLARGVVSILLVARRFSPGTDPAVFTSPGSHARHRLRRHCITGGLVLLTPPGSHA